MLVSLDNDLAYSKIKTFATKHKFTAPIVFWMKPILKYSILKFIKTGLERYRQLYLSITKLPGANLLQSN